MYQENRSEIMESGQDKKPVTASYQTAVGKLPYRLTNDYLFRALLQRSNKVLKHLTCALKHLHPEDVKSVTIENPIVLGEAIDNKTYVLDVRARMQDGSIVNYEMQVLNRGNWPERSLAYLCRCFDQLQKGEDYLAIRSVTHIGFVDFTLFPEAPEFYASYQMMNLKNYHIYTDKFTLNVVNLNRIDLATAEDREWQIDHWAALFRATTWEEIRMLAENNEVLQEAAATVYQLSQEEMIQEQCRAREDYERLWNTINRRLERATAELGELKEENGELKEENSELKAELARLQRLLAEKEAE